MIKDRPWAERELTKYLRLLERVPTGETTDAGNPRTKVRGTKAQIAQQLHVARRICDELFVDTPYHLQPEHVRAALAELKRGDEMDAALGDDDSPTMSADGLHPWSWSAASSLWASGAHRAAVWAAMVNVNSRMQKKLGRTDLGEMKLIQEAFSVKDPEPGKPRLRLCDDSNPNLFNDLHVGAMSRCRPVYGDKERRKPRQFGRHGHEFTRGAGVAGDPQPVCSVGTSFDRRASRRRSLIRTRGLRRRSSSVRLANVRSSDPGLSYVGRQAIARGGDLRPAICYAPTTQCPRL